jgi:hypothetical protein
MISMHDSNGFANFQAGHAGSIPVIRSCRSAAYFELFAACFLGPRARYVPDRLWSEAYGPLGRRRRCCQYQAMVDVTVEARNDVDNPGVVKLQGGTWERLGYRR